jgi:hypothetical protein
LKQDRLVVTPPSVLNEIIAQVHLAIGAPESEQVAPAPARAAGYVHRADARIEGDDAGRPSALRERDQRTRENVRRRRAGGGGGVRVCEKRDRAEEEHGE